MRHKIPALALGLLILGTSQLGCTKAGLYGAKDEPSLPDKLTLSGTVCSDNPLQRRLPVKVVLLIDASSHGSTNTCGAINPFKTGAVNDLFQIYSGASEISWAVVKYDGETEGLTNDTFTRDAALLAQAATRAGLLCTGDGSNCNDRRYKRALERADNIITGDLLSSEMGARARTRYVVVLYAEGPRFVGGPNGMPDPSTAYCCDHQECIVGGGTGQCPRAATSCDNGCYFEWYARKMHDFAVDNGAADLVVHTAHFPSAPGAAACSTLGPPAADCTGTGAADDQCDARNVLARTAAASGGNYLQYPSLGQVNLQALEYSASNNVFIMKSLVVANVNAKPGTGGFAVDTDADGLSDDEERALGTDPALRDTDGDGLGDYVESMLSNLDLDPLVPDSPVTCRDINPTLDRDGDGLRDCEEVLLGTDPTLFDTDADGYPDILEFMYGTNFLFNDSNDDTDQDGVRNGDELRFHTDPRSNDARTRGDLSYLYRVVVQDGGDGRGLSRVLDIQQPTAISGVTIRTVHPRVYPGVSLMQFNRASQELSWRDNYGGGSFGPAVRVDRRTTYTLHAPGSVAGDNLQERSITIDVVPQALPARDLGETLQVRETERQCLDWRVRNITLVHTAPRNQQQVVQDFQAGSATEEGFNRLMVFYGQTPLSNPLGPGLYRVARVPAVFVPPEYKDPDVAEVNVRDTDFVLLGENLGTTP